MGGTHFRFETEAKNDSEMAYIHLPTTLSERWLQEAEVFKFTYSQPKYM